MGAAIDFLTRTGQMCDDKRQEFILLSDTLGVSVLVDAINHRVPEQDLDSDVVLGVKDSLIREFKRLPAGSAVAGRKVDRPCYHLDHDFTLKVQAVEFHDRNMLVAQHP